MIQSGCRSSAKLASVLVFHLPGRLCILRATQSKKLHEVLDVLNQPGAKSWFTWPGLGCNYYVHRDRKKSERTDDS